MNRSRGRAIRPRSRQWAVRPLATGALLFATGCGYPAPEPHEAPEEARGDLEPGPVTGIGGIFFKSADPARTLEWYRTHLGIASSDWGGFAFLWAGHDRPEETGYTIWSAFPDTSGYFSPSHQPFMVNFRVADLAGLIASLREAGVEVVGEIEEHPNGKFAWILDLEGRKVELWEPVASSADPYLR